ncbi:DUF5667 domain-containing protein [Actinomycetospora straminea]|uniref:DUF5667 domain-containing protein n=1 Tax=Actinomycetospora straminea TaxID=663607 RepID=A0ABP9E385_9PSEU|nr:DUF5667 domain-containing protein [Actinomycetospora straminea]MDD7931452.1 DUF5667 domain-containing protein [Actinomycetospora straminea]
MSSGHDEDDELFARVWEQRDATGRPPHPGRAGGGPDPMRDPDLARDLELAAALRAAGRDAIGPDADASARMRAVVMGEVMGEVMAEIGGGTATPPRERTRVLRSPDSGPVGGRGAGRAGATTRRGSTRPGDGRPGRAATRRRSTRLISSLIGGACAVMLLGALTVLLSRGALPGEMLYGIKRASESAEIGLTSGQEAKGQRHLDFAATRLEEVSDLIGRDTATAAGAGPVAAGIGPEEAALVLENLRDFDEQARTGSRLILPLAGRSSGPSPSQLAEWAREQSARIDTLSPSLDTDGRGAAAQSQQMLQRLGQRATALGGPQRCATGGESDDLGPLPIRECDTSTSPSVATPERTDVSATETSSTTTTTTTTSRTSTSSSESSTRDGGADEDSGSGGESDDAGDDAPPPVQVPLPVPLLPQVDVPPLLPGLPGLSLG